MRVLVACEYSGTVRDAFIAKGHDAMSCDLVPSWKPGPHYQGSVFDIIDNGWDLLIAHPPCTFLSNAGARHLYKGGVLQQGRYEKGLEGKAFFMQLWNSKIPKKCIENPIPSKIFQLPHYTQIVQPFWFGHPNQKKTCLWLDGLSPLVATNKVTPSCTMYTDLTIFGSGELRARLRAKTFKGLAEAMAEQWG